MTSLASTRAVLLDALGTLVELDPPWPHLAKALGTEPDEGMVEAVRAEMRYYRDHSHEGRDAPSLAQLRRRCAGVLSRELGREVSVETMMAAIRFRAYDDAARDMLGAGFQRVRNLEGGILAWADRIDPSFPKY